jgi:hypothetical protein
MIGQAGKRSRRYARSARHPTGTDREKRRKEVHDKKEAIVHTDAGVRVLNQRKEVMPMRKIVSPERKPKGYGQENPAGNPSHVYSSWERAKKSI